MNDYLLAKRKDRLIHGKEDFSKLHYLVINNDVVNFTTDSDEKFLISYELYTTSEKGNPQWDFIINNVATELHIPQPIISRLFNKQVLQGYLIRYPRQGRTGPIPHKLNREKLLSDVGINVAHNVTHNEVNK